MVSGQNYILHCYLILQSTLFFKKCFSYRYIDYLKINNLLYIPNWAYHRFQHLKLYSLFLYMKLTGILQPKKKQLLRLDTAQLCFVKLCYIVFAATKLPWDLRVVVVEGMGHRLLNVIRVPYCKQNQKKTCQVLNF